MRFSVLKLIVKKVVNLKPVILDSMVIKLFYQESIKTTDRKTGDTFWHKA